MDKKLNSQQLKAVQHKTGPLLVIAGAGTGKTTVITERIKYLIAEGLATSDEILALTFTEKAAAEMQDRLDEVMLLGYSKIFIGTFHSFCEQFLRDEGIKIGLDYEFDLLTGVDGVALFKKNIYKFSLDYYRPLGNPHKFIEAILDHFSRLKDENVSVDEYKQWLNNQSSMTNDQSELVKLYSEWEQVKTDNSVLEFADLIYYTLKTLRDRPKVAEKYQQRFKYILVDEYQDTNYAQNQILQNLAAKHQNVTVVADDDQSIYRFRGAAVGNVLSFFETYKNAKTIVLTQNYRSGQKILDAAYKLISNNNPDRLEIKANIDKKLVALKGKPEGEVIFQKFARGEDEAEWIASQIPNNNYKDNAILVRSNSQAELFVKALERAGIPVQFLGPAQLFSQPEVKDLIAILRTIDNPDDDISLYRVLAMDVWKIDKNYLAGFFAKIKHTGKTLFEVCGEEDLGPINFIKSAIEKSSSCSAGQILYDFLTGTKVLTTIEDESKAKNIVKFFKRIKNFEDNREGSVRMVVDWIDLNMQIGESPQASIDSDWRQNDAVNILTVHSAKGLEFDTVFMTNLVMDRFPSRNRRDQLPIPIELIKEKLPELDFHLQEERRLFYVGMTRAKSRLYLTASDFYGETKRAKKVSPFVGETNVQIPNSNSQINPKFENYEIKNSLKINTLSYSHISTFEECPAHYRAKYILGISEPATAMTTLGTVVHKALNSEDPLETYRKSWKDAGFMSPQQRKETKILGEKILKEYLLDEKYSKHKPEFTEYQFSVPVAVDLKITGRMDRVDIWEDGTVEIIDYKTSSKLPEQKEVDKNLQLSFYALAADALKLGTKIKLTLYFLQFGQTLSTYRTPEQLDKAREEILKIRDEIQNSNFACTGFYCDSCAFKMLCDR